MELDRLDLPQRQNLKKKIKKTRNLKNPLKGGINLRLRFTQTDITLFSLSSDLFECGNME